MSVAQRIIVDDIAEVSQEAKDRLSSARAHDISFIIKQRLGKTGTPEDVDMLVEMVLHAEEAQHPLTLQYMNDYLRSRGRTAHKAELLISALIR